MKICNSSKEEFKEQITVEGEEMNVKIVTVNVKKNGKFARYSNPSRTGKRAIKK